MKHERLIHRIYIQKSVAFLYTNNEISEREKQIPYANTYIWNLKRKENGSEETRGRTGMKQT